MAETYTLHVAGLTRELTICKVNDHMDIAAFIMLGDAELTVAAATELLKKCPEFDILLTAEAKSIPLIHEMARQSGAKTYFIARKGLKVYLTDAIHVTVHSITTQHVSMGTRVTVVEEGFEDEPEEYAIVGSQEADVMSRAVSEDSPFGKALMGHKAGEEVAVEAPRGVIRYRIDKIER
mgnify:CR=1 FL=1